MGERPWKLRRLTFDVPEFLGAFSSASSRDSSAAYWTRHAPDYITVQTRDPGGDWQDYKPEEKS